jgi:glycosyltransferase involved in cell wall biosynthesis
MDIAIVAPCPVPYQRGGAENLWRGLQDHLNEATPHQAEIIKLPSREFSFFELVDSYRRFSELDLSGFDLVVSSKYPAWMVRHPNHVVYMLHRLRGLYDAYESFGLSREVTDPPNPVRELLALLDDGTGRPDSELELYARVEALRPLAEARPELFAFPGPLIRRVVHFLDAIGLAPERVRRYGAIARTVAERHGTFPEGVPVFVAHPPSELATLPPRRGSYLFTASRLDGPKRIELLIRAMAHASPRVRLRIAGTGPEAGRLREAAGGDPRVELLGRVPSAELARLYAGARAVAFVPLQEDFGLIALEGMRAGKPVLTCIDSGGATELVVHGENGLVVAPEPEALGQAMTELHRDGRAARRMGRAGRRRAAQVTWTHVVDHLLASA